MVGLSLTGWAEILVLTLAWAGAAAGVTLRQVWLDAPQWVVAIPYVLVGWCPGLMKTKIGSVNYAYLFAFSQFFMAWIVAGIYVKKAGVWDAAAAAIIAKFKKN